MINTTQITWKIFDTSFGRFIAGITAKGCCLLEFWDRKGLPNILHRLNKRHNLAMDYGDHPLLDQIEQELQAYLDGKLQNFTFPLDIKGTEFQMQVWEQLLHIPYGETWAYQDIAKRINNPNAVRAVGKANGDNNIAIVIPCHRVIGSNGKLEGYGGGIHRKEYLLKLEQKNRSDNQITISSEHHVSSKGKNQLNKWIKA